LVDGFFYSRGVVHHEYATQGQTVTNGYYERVLCRFVMLCGQTTGPMGSKNLAPPSRQCTRPFFTSDPRFFG
jgi:hypothetical protein